MRVPKVPSILALVALLFGLASVRSVAAEGATPGGTTATVARVNAAALRGPYAVQVAAADPGYGLFSCQVGLSVGQC